MVMVQVVLLLGLRYVEPNKDRDNTIGQNCSRSFTHQASQPIRAYKKTNISVIHPSGQDAPCQAHVEVTWHARMLAAVPMQSLPQLQASDLKAGRAATWQTGWTETLTSIPGRLASSLAMHIKCYIDCE